MIKEQVSRWQNFIISFYIFIAILLILISVFSYQSFHSIIEKENWVKHTHQVIDSGKEVLLALEEAETNQRGYIITSDSIYLKTYQSSLRKTQLYHDSLIRLTKDNPAKQEKIRKLKEIIQVKISSMNRTIHWKNHGKDKELNLFFKEAKGLHRMDDVRAQLNDILEAEEKLLSTRTQELDRYRQLTLRAIYVLSLLALLVIILLWFLFRQHIRIKAAYEHSLHQKNMQLKATNEELQAGAEEINAGHEQLIVVNEELNHSYSLLSQINEQLEQIVKDKTAELRETNRKLRIEIAEKELAKDAYQKARDLYHDLYDNAPEMYLSINMKDARFINFNQAVLNKLGYSKDELSELSMLDLNHLDFVELATDAAKVLSETDRVENAPLKIKTKEGKVLDVLQNSTAIRNEAGEIIGIRSCWQDFTELKKMQDELREREELYRMITENASDLISKHRLDGTYTYASPASLPLLGYRQEELLGKSAFSFFHPEDVNAVRKLLFPVNQIPDQLQFTYRKKKKNGTYIWYETTSKALRNSKNELVELLCISRDITERKLAEEELKLNAQKLLLANKEMESFSYSVSHDLRAPLRAIIGFSKILQNEFADKLGEEGRALTGYVIKNTTKMGMLIDDLLAFSRLGRQEKSEAEFKMDKLVKDVVNELKIAHLDRKINFTVNSLPNAFGDHSLIRHVLTNILSNAVKFSSTRETAEITVSSYKQDGEVVYKFQDNGVGFNMRYVGKIFDVFQRLHSESEFPGTGIGLALAQKIIHRHGGRIWAEGEVGKGATFCFTLGKTH